MAIHHVAWNQPFPDSCHGGALTIGNFDGVHRGHQSLLKELGRQAQLAGGPAVAMTFDPPPSHLLRPMTAQAELTTLEDRTRLMLEAGADQVLVLRTTNDLLQRSAWEFFHEVIVRALGAKVVVPGFNFAFGHDREGNVETLARMCKEAGIGCLLVPPLNVDGGPVSSSRIRGELRRGNMKFARVLLGRPYRLTGTVTVGAKRGKTLGFPTANLEGIATLVPADGVYGVRVHVEGRAHAGAANIGANPTFNDNRRKVEVHLLDYSGELYGMTLGIEFLERLRDTRRFSNAAELVEQLGADIAAARRIADDEVSRR